MSRKTMKTCLSFRISLLSLFSSLTFLASLLTSCEKEYEEVPGGVEFGSHGLIPGKEYVVTFPDSLISGFKDIPVSLNLILRYNDQVKIRDLMLDIEFASLYSDSIETESLEIPLFDNNGKGRRIGQLGIFQKEITISDSTEVGEGFFFSFKTEQKNTSGFIDATVTIRRKTAKIAPRFLQ